MEAIAEVGEEREDRIDHQRPAPVIVCDVELDLISADGVAAGHDLSLAAPLLKDHRSVLADRPGVSVQKQIAIRFHPDALRPFEAEVNGTRVRSGGDDEVIFELSIAAVEKEIDSRIDLAIADALVNRHIADPFGAILTQEVI